MAVACSRCSGPNDRQPQKYCTTCHAAYMREHRPKHSALTDEARKKANTRAYTNVLLKRGHLIKKVCESCGDPNSQAHHEDYNDPRTVKWLCRACHLEHHNTHHVEHKESNMKNDIKYLAIMNAAAIIAAQGLNAETGEASEFTLDNAVLAAHGLHRKVLEHDKLIDAMNLVD